MKTNIGGIIFENKIFGIIIDNYSEQLTHTSLSIEKSFEKLEQYTEKLLDLIEEKKEIFKKLPEEKQKEIKNTYRYFITYTAYYKKIIPNINFNNQREIDTNYNKYFKEFDDYMTKLLVFDENNNLLFNDTGKKVSAFFLYYTERKPILEEANNAQLDHIEAFGYALGQDHIGPKEILEINRLVNYNNPNKQEGYKKVNNIITGSTINTMKKEEVSNQIAELVYKYDNNFDMEIKSYEEKGITEEEKMQRLFLIYLKEAKFHILFEHIHPFVDGNGRTGRIIMSSNLIKNHIAPPLITSVMFGQYKKYINDYDYEGLAKMIMDSSSQTLSNWVAIKREQEGISINDLINSKIL